MTVTQQTLRIYWRAATRYPKYLWAVGFFVPLNILAGSFLLPYILSRVLNQISAHHYDPHNIWGSFGVSIAAYIALVIFNQVLAFRIIIWCGWQLELLVQRDLAQRVFAHLMQQSANFHANRFGGSLVSQATKFWGAYVRLADTTIFNLSGLVFGIIFTVAIMLPRAPLYVAIMLLFAAAFIAVALATAKRVRHLNIAEAAAQNEQTGYLADNLTNVLAVKSFAHDSYEFERFKEATRKTRRTGKKLVKVTIMRETLFSTISGGISIAALLIAIVGVTIFHSDIGTLFLIATYTANIAERLWQFNGVIRNYNRAFGDAAEMTKILQLEPEVKDPAEPEKPRMLEGAITFAGMTFRHADAQEDDALFEDFSLSIAAGEKIGLVGHSGSGKTTLTRLLLRFADIDKGEILVDGQNIAHVTQQDLRQAIAYVPQEPLLFHRSLRENIAYGKPEASDEEIREAALRAHAAEFIEKLPDGYDTLVGERGVKLSGGQRQRIAIARAILKDAPILVLDEATSALDSESEKLIQSALWELMKGRTAIVIAHRLSTIQKMDRIVVLEDGKIVEQGSHKELVAHSGTYAELWHHQSGGFIEE